MHSQSVLITGASGLLGANLVLEWRSRGWSPIALYRKHAISLGVPAFAADLGDFDYVQELVERKKPHWIVHCAAATDVDWCEDHQTECQRINVDATRNLAVAANAVGARFVYISTDAVFDGERGDYEESDSVCPINVYANSKVLAEQAAAEALPDTMIVRTNIYGWNLQNKLSLAEWMLRNFENRTPFPGFDDVVFCPILANDLADVLAEMMTLGLKGVFHVGASETCSKFIFAQRIAELFGYDRGLVEQSQVGRVPLRASRPRNMSLNTARVRLALGHELPDIRAGLERFKSLRSHGYVERLKSAAL